MGSPISQSGDEWMGEPNPQRVRMASGHGTGGQLAACSSKISSFENAWKDGQIWMMGYFFHIFYHFLGLKIFPTNFEIIRRAWCQALSRQIRIIRTVRLLRFLRGQGIMLVNGIRHWPQLTTVTVSVGTLTWTCLLTPKTTGLKLHVFPRNNSGSILRFDWSSSADLAFFTNLRIPHPMSNQNRFLGGTRILSQLSPTSWMKTGDPLCTASWSTHC